MESDNSNLQRLIAKVGLEKCSGIIQKLLLPSVRLLSTPTESELPLGASRIGGCPDLPFDQVWPQLEDDGNTRRALPFLAQVNLTELAALEANKFRLPEGTLFFFSDPDTGAWRLLFHAGDSQGLQRTDFPGDLPQTKHYREHKIELYQELTLPFYGHHGAIGGEEQPVFFDVLDPALASYHFAEEEDAYEVLVSDLKATLLGTTASGGINEHHRMFGWPEYVQNPMKLDAQLASQGIKLDYETYLTFMDIEHPRTIALKADTEAADWMLLLQIGSIYSEPNMIWGDGGIHYLWIRRADLEQGNFAKVYYDLQMG